MSSTWLSTLAPGRRNYGTGGEPRRCIGDTSAEYSKIVVRSRDQEHRGGILQRPGGWKEKSGGSGALPRKKTYVVSTNPIVQSTRLWVSFPGGKHAVNFDMETSGIVSPGNKLLDFSVVWKCLGYPIIYVHSIWIAIDTLLGKLRVKN